MTEQNISEYLTGEEFAERARVTIRAIRRWASKGVGPEPIRPTGARIVRYRSQDVEDWLSGKSTRAGAV